MDNRNFDTEKLIIEFKLFGVLHVITSQIVFKKINVWKNWLIYLTFLKIVKSAKNINKLFWIMDLINIASFNSYLVVLFTDMSNTTCNLDVPTFGTLTPLCERNTSGKILSDAFFFKCMCLHELLIFLWFQKWETVIRCTFHLRNTILRYCGSHSTTSVFSW